MSTEDRCFIKEELGIDEDDPSSLRNALIQISVLVEKRSEQFKKEHNKNFPYLTLSKVMVLLYVNDLVKEIFSEDTINETIR